MEGEVGGPAKTRQKEQRRNSEEEKEGKEVYLSKLILLQL
jgi:hypothetical protein